MTLCHTQRSVACLAIIKEASSIIDKHRDPQPDNILRVKDLRTLDYARGYVCQIPTPHDQGTL